MKPKGEAAPAQPVTLYCGEPGCGKPFEWVPRGGRRPKYGRCHKRGANVERAELAYKARANMQEDITAATAAAREAGLVGRLAAGMRMSPDLETAAGLAGITIRGPALEQLAALARQRHEQLITGDMRETAQFAEGFIHLLMMEGAERLKSMTARDLALFTRTAQDARDAFKGDGPQQNWIAINIAVEPPRPLTEEERARVHGNEPSTEEARNVKAGADRSG